MRCDPTTPHAKVRALLSLSLFFSSFFLLFFARLAIDKLINMRKFCRNVSASGFRESQFRASPDPGWASSGMVAIGRQAQECRESVFQIWLLDDTAAMADIEGQGYPRFISAEDEPLLSKGQARVLCRCDEPGSVGLGFAPISRLGFDPSLDVPSPQADAVKFPQKNREKNRPTASPV